MAPVSVSTTTLKIGDLELVCHVLDDGTRVVEEESVFNFLSWLESDLPTSQEEIERVADWIKGKVDA